MEGSNRPTVGNTLATGRLPQLGNAEFGFVVLANLVGLFVVLISHITIDAWWQLFVVLNVVYVLSRGIAKASRVFEQ